MRVTKDMLKRLITKEFQKKTLNEKRRLPDRQRGGNVDISDEAKTLIAHALDILETSVGELGKSEAEEARWYLTKIGESFGMEPEEDEEED